MKHKNALTPNIDKLVEKSTAFTSHFPSLPPLLFNMLDNPYETNNLAIKKEYLEIQNNLLSKLLSHRMLHQERQLSNGMLSKSGMKITSGPSNRKRKE